MLEKIPGAGVVQPIFSLSDCEFVVELMPNASKSNAKQLGLKIQGDTICIVGITKKCEFSVLRSRAGIIFTLSDSPLVTLFWGCSLIVSIRNSAGEIVWEPNTTSV